MKGGAAHQRRNGTARPVAQFHDAAVGGAVAGREPAEVPHVGRAGHGDPADQGPGDGPHEQAVSEDRDRPARLGAQPAQEVPATADQVGEGLGAAAGLLRVGALPVRLHVRLALDGGHRALPEIAQVGELLDRPLLARGRGEPLDGRLGGLPGPPVRRRHDQGRGLTEAGGDLLGLPVPERRQHAGAGLPGRQARVGLALPVPDQPHPDHRAHPISATWSSSGLVSRAGRCADDPRSACPLELT
jgi:hypothetical protein